MTFASLVVIRDLLNREVETLEASYKVAVRIEADAEFGTAEHAALRDARRSAYAAYDRVRSALVEFDINQW